MKNCPCSADKVGPIMIVLKLEDDRPKQARECNLKFVANSTFLQRKKDGQKRLNTQWTCDLQPWCEGSRPTCEKPMAGSAKSIQPELLTAARLQVLSYRTTWLETHNHAISVARSLRAKRGRQTNYRSRRKCSPP